ncbi:sialidase family protein [Niabella ginsengisoli]|uniref:exo-alpha-sialidase n=1 Tax=Niabella ginsengisoli TaxID=522298 RepID=A0ABS9SN51_9BACT|nr:sialidase family protein [Niabella ginsengisoli]MCH5599818.1 glycoside hydrolase [Niabella ginsengisoli]
MTFYKEFSFPLLFVVIFFGFNKRQVNRTNADIKDDVARPGSITNCLPSVATIKIIRLFSADTDGYNSYRIPCLAKAKNGNLIAFAEGRKHSVLDYGDIDLVYKISLDNGESWSGIKIVVSESEGTWGNPTAVTDEETGRIWLFMSYNDEAHSQHGGSFGSRSYDIINTWGQRRVFITYSDDNGLSWQKPKDNTSSLLPPNFTWDAVGPGIGIQTKTGAKKGRLIIPAGRRNIYSDDHGLTWKYQSIPGGTFEGSVVELSNGSLLRNDRGVGSKWANNHNRFISQGTIEAGFSAFRPDPGLPDPRCQASILRYSFSPNILLFLNPARNDKDGAANRCLMTVRLSEDDGSSWKYSKLLYDDLDSSIMCKTGLGGYSSLMKTADKYIVAMTEVNHSVEKMPAAQRRFSIDFHKFNLEWIKNDLREITY